MQKLLADYERDTDLINPVVLVSNFHYDFAKIHPFVDGNGRTIRLLLNMILMKK